MRERGGKSTLLEVARLKFVLFPVGAVELLTARGIPHSRWGSARARDCQRADDGKSRHVARTVPGAGFASPWCQSGPARGADSTHARMVQSWAGFSRLFWSRRRYFVLVLWLGSPRIRTNSPVGSSSRIGIGCRRSVRVGPAVDWVRGAATFRSSSQSEWPGAEESEAVVFARSRGA